MLMPLPALPVAAPAAAAPAANGDSRAALEEPDPAAAAFATDAAANGDCRTLLLLLIAPLLPMLPVTKPLLCIPRVLVDDRVALLPAPATPRRLLLWLLDCCRSLPLPLPVLCPEGAAGGLPAALLSTEPEGPVIALAMLLHRA